MLDRLHIELIHVFPTWGLMGSKSKPEDNGKNGNGINHEILRYKTNTDAFLSNRGYKGKGSIVTSMFGGTLQNEVRCGVCGIESKKNDPFLDLSLDIPQSANGEARLEDCLSRFVDVEELSDSDKYYCSHCKTHQKSTKRFWIRRLPNVLCLHLKRFRWANYLRQKLDHFVQFPLTELDMSEYLLRNNHTTRGSSDSFMYDLAAVIVHHGTGVGTGHYTAFAKNDEQWYHFNDSTVKPSEESAVAKCKAYILFYTRKEIRS
jgi:ubiquitin carboxyl-terminal hydrolase 3